MTSPVFIFILASDPKLIESINLALAPIEARFLSFLSAAAVLDCLETLHPDLLIAEGELAQEKNGQLLSVLNNAPHNVPVILITKDGAVDEAVVAMHLGVLDCIERRYVALQLGSRVRVALREHT